MDFVNYFSIRKIQLVKPKFSKSKPDVLESWELTNKIWSRMQKITVYTYLYSLEYSVLNHHTIQFQKVVREKEKKQHILSFLAHSTSLLVRICVSCFSIGFNIYLLSEFHGVSKKKERPLEHLVLLVSYPKNLIFFIFLL